MDTTAQVLRGLYAGLAGIFCLAICATLLLLFIRRKKLPMAAHGMFSTVFKLLAALLFLLFLGPSVFFTWTPFTLFFFVYLPILYVGPVILRCHIIYFTFRINHLKSKLAKLMNTKEQREANESMFNKQHFVISTKFLIILIILLLALHFPFFIGSLITYIVLDTTTSFSKAAIVQAFDYFAFAFAFISTVLCSIILIGFLIAMFVYKVRENFSIVRGIVINVVHLIVIAVLIIAYAGYIVALPSAGLSDGAQQIVSVVIRFLLSCVVISDVLFTIDIPLIRTFFWKTNTVRPSSNLSPEILAVLQDAQARKAFKDYATQEFSVENLLFYEQIEQLKALTDEKEHVALATNIETNFVSTTGLLTLNVDAPVRQKVKQALEKQPYSISECNEAMRQVLTAVSQNMYDTFNRYIQTPEYKQHLAVSNAKNQLGWTV
jgi:MFS family permease